LTTSSPNDESLASLPSLTDPVSCGEDLSFNLRTVSGLAEKYCGSCAGYHVLYAAKRLMPFARIVDLDRKEVAATIGKLAAERLASSGSSLEVVIAGAADTGLLAGAAHGIALVGRAALDRSRFTILDRCRTPLELCRSFGRGHRLTVETDVVDLVADQTRRSADLVVVHSLLRYVPKEAHADLLRKFGQWLRPQGRIVFSGRLEDDDAGTGIFEADQRHFGEELRRRIRDGELQIGDRAEVFDAQLNQRSAEQIAGYGDLTGLQALFDRAQMPVFDTQIVQGVVRRSGKEVMRRRAIVVLGAPRSYVDNYRSGVNA
jgi:SAM-dependent methyltransferase